VKEIIFFSNNKNKYLEISKLFRDTSIKILSLNNFNKINSPNENGVTFKENAKIKSNFGLKTYKKPCFADDSGICIEAMNNNPGINSKKFLEQNNSALDTFNLIFSLVNKTKKNKAFFQTSICLSLKAKKHVFFNGIVKGTITQSIIGSGGFGYDPIFVPLGYKKTFAEMTVEEKNLVSHRSIAINKLKKYLLTLI
jgi:XTP/dITP diphosphohydrolase